MNRHGGLSAGLVAMIVVVALGAARPATAQGLAAGNFSVSAGYSFMHDTSGSGTNFSKGGDIDFAMFFAPLFGAEVEVGGWCEDEEFGTLDESWMVYTIQGGPTFKIPRLVNPWLGQVHVLAGVAIDSVSVNSGPASHSTHFSLDPGVDFDYMFKPHWGARFDGGVRFVNEANETSRQFHVGAGIVYRP